MTRSRNRNNRQPAHEHAQPLSPRSQHNSPSLARRLPHSYTSPYPTTTSNSNQFQHQFQHQYPFQEDDDPQYDDHPPANAKPATPAKPQASMSPASRLAWNLKVLQRHDPSIHSILDQVSYAVLYNYNFDTNSDGSLVGWEKRGVEGSMFIYERKTEPRYGFFILNRNGIGNFIQTMSKDDDLELTDDDDYIIFRSNSTIDPLSANQANLCVGLWIFEQVARRRIADYMMELHALIQREASAASDAAAAAGSTSTPAPASGPAVKSTPTPASAQPQSQSQSQSQSHQPPGPTEARPLDSLFSRIRITSENLDRAQPLAAQQQVNSNDGDGGGGGTGGGGGGGGGTGSTGATGDADILGALLNMLPKSATASAHLASGAAAPSTPAKGTVTTTTVSAPASYRRTALNKTPVSVPRTPSPEELINPNTRGVGRGHESPASPTSFSPVPAPAHTPAAPSRSVFDAPKVNGARNGNTNGNGNGSGNGRQPLRERPLVPFDMSFAAEPLEAPPSPSRFPSQHQHRRNMVVNHPKQMQRERERDRDRERERGRERGGERETYTPVNTKMVSTLEREKVCGAVVDVFEGKESKEGGEGVPRRNDFVRELLALIHTDSKFVDELYASYVRKVESESGS
ncbi:hypothetical protein BOTBODRAFT_36326 [Botryobasidium botryosum FD-172 SS1]|uniref:mRNA-decapping enzyme C-terminal domain-containing protein n=1 Tax=Botryobasidium botryosum (strain FD-172 SS1) TaxID=930990 RepID=A0A067MFT2_BOTB1|nr:hypothetical protein BOTBODRAFT_36326 [Botryobasidium botryosum FD-172 SS1]